MALARGIASVQLRDHKPLGEANLGQLAPPRELHSAEDSLLQWLPCSVFSGEMGNTVCKLFVQCYNFRKIKRLLISRMDK